MKKNLTTLALVIAAGNAQAGLPEGYSIALEFDQNIEDVAQEMLDWWWNNIRTEERFID